MDLNEIQGILKRGQQRNSSGMYQDPDAGALYMALGRLLYMLFRRGCLGEKDIEYVIGDER